MRRFGILLTVSSMMVLSLPLAIAQQSPGQRMTASVERLHAVPPGQVKLLESDFKRRSELNRSYLYSLTNQNLLQNFYMEAGLWNPQFRQTAMGPTAQGDDIHWGWESPTCQLRGHFLGHWLSAAAYLAASTGDTEMKAKAD